MRREREVKASTLTNKVTLGSYFIDQTIFPRERGENWANMGEKKTMDYCSWAERDGTGGQITAGTNAHDQMTFYCKMGGWLGMVLILGGDRQKTGFLGGD